MQTHYFTFYFIFLLLFIIFIIFLSSSLWFIGLLHRFFLPFFVVVVVVVFSVCFRSNSYKCTVPYKRICIEISSSDLL